MSFVFYKEIFKLGLDKEIRASFYLYQSNYLRNLFNSSNNASLRTLMYVPFIPKDLDSITPALSNLRNAFTITERVIPTLSAILLAISNPSLPSNFSKMWKIAQVLNMIKSQ